jgi:hypothetical protein
MAARKIKMPLLMTTAARKRPRRMVTAMQAGLNLRAPHSRGFLSSGVLRISHGVAPGATRPSVAPHTQMRTSPSEHRSDPTCVMPMKPKNDPTADGELQVHLQNLPKLAFPPSDGCYSLTLFDFDFGSSLYEDGPRGAPPHTSALNHVRHVAGPQPASLCVLEHTVLTSAQHRFDTS